MSDTWHDGEAELYFYGELDEAARGRFEAHLAGCEACRRALDELEVIRQALAARRQEAEPPGGDWGPFMQRLDARLDRAGVGHAARGWSGSWLVKVAATIAIAAAGLIGGFEWQRWRAERAVPAETTARATVPAVAGDARPSPADTLSTVTDQHLERSKLVLFGLASKDPSAVRPADWQYERQLASTLLADTTQYRLAASAQGRADLADVLGDLETVLLEASLGDHSDPRALGRLQRLIGRRDLLTKIEVMTPDRRGRDHE